MPTRNSLTFSFSVFTLFLAGLYLLMQGCLALQDYFFTQRALFEVSASIRHETLFFWDMEQEGELLELEKHDLDNLHFEKGLLKARSKGKDPYFWLNFKGRTLDAKIYDVIQIRFFSSARSQMQLHLHFLETGKVVYGTSNIPVGVGWQTITLPLNNRKWQAFSNNKGKIQVQTRQWGGQTQIVTGVRLDPLIHSGIDFSIDWIKFLPSSDLSGSNTNTQKTTVESLRDSILSVNLLTQSWESIGRQIAALRGSTSIVVDASPWRLPQSSLWLQEEIKKKAPQVIFFPRPINFNKMITQASVLKEDLADPLTTWRRSLLLISLLTIGCTALFLIYVKKASTQLSARTELGLVLVFSTLLWLLSAQSLDWLFISNAFGFLFVSIFLLSHRYGSNWPKKLGLIWPSKAETLRVLFLTLPIAGLMIFLSIYYGRFSSTNWSKLLEGFLVYPFWGVVQQIYLGPILTGLILSSINANRKPSTRVAIFAAILAGFLFSLVHAPNFSLMSATFLIGACWSYLYQRYGSIIPLAISHGILGSLFRELAPLQLHMNGSVGLGHFDWLWF